MIREEGKNWSEEEETNWGEGAISFPTLTSDFLILNA
jgi:hypothetical protein